MMILLIEQIQQRRGADAWNKSMDDGRFNRPDQVVEQFDDQVVQAMAKLNQQPPCNKDSKAIGSICPHLRAAVAYRNGRFDRC